MNTVLGAHRFIANIISNEDEGPTVSILMKVFSPFVRGDTIKNYVFKRIKKSLLLELALCILQDVASNGIERLATLELEIERTASGGKTVVIKPPPEFPIENENEREFLSEIDEIIFNFKDSLGNSPAIKFAAGAGRTPSYSPPDDLGNFVTPQKRGVPKALAKSFEVRHLPILQ
jgi:hypothetical protein